MCDQQRLRPACSYAQSDLSLCSSLDYSTSVKKLQTEHHLEFLSLKGGCTGSSESTLVKMPHCWKSHGTAQLLFHLLQKHNITLETEPHKKNGLTWIKPGTTQIFSREEDSGTV